MQPVIKADGTIFNPPRHLGSGRPAKYPWRYLEVGDHFEAPHKARASLLATISTLKNADRVFVLNRGVRIGTFRVTRTA